MQRIISAPMGALPCNSRGERLSQLNEEMYR